MATYVVREESCFSRKCICFCAPFLLLLAIYWPFIRKIQSYAPDCIASSSFPFEDEIVRVEAPFDARYGQCKMLLGCYDESPKNGILTLLNGTFDRAAVYHYGTGIWSDSHILETTLNEIADNIGIGKTIEQQIEVDLPFERDAGDRVYYLVLNYPEELDLKFYLPSALEVSKIVQIEERRKIQIAIPILFTIGVIALISTLCFCFCRWRKKKQEISEESAEPTAPELEYQAPAAQPTFQIPMHYQATMNYPTARSALSKHGIHG